jgi:hypothetical protein
MPLLPFFWFAADNVCSVCMPACMSLSPQHTLVIGADYYHASTALSCFGADNICSVCISVCLNVYPQHTLIIGADYYESEEQRQKVLAEGGVPLGVGAGTVIKNCIVDKNARIGRNVKIVNEGGVQASRQGRL